MLIRSQRFWEATEKPEIRQFNRKIMAGETVDYGITGHFSCFRYYSQPTPHMRIRRLFEAPVSLLTELRLLMWVEFLLRRLDMDVQSSSYMQA